MTGPNQKSFTVRRRDHPKADESFFGYLVRIAELNGYDNAAWLLHPSHTRVGNSVMSGSAAEFLKGADLASLADLMAVPTEELQRLAERNLQFSLTRRMLLQAFQVPRNALAKDAKICPECLQDSPYCRAAWDAPIVTGCVVHQRMLIDQCPNCGVGIKRLRPQVAHCHCGMDWRTVSRTSQLNETEVRILRTIYFAMAIHSGLHSEELPNQNALSSREFETKLERVLNVASQVHSLTTVSTTNVRVSNAQLHRLLVRGFSAYENWPHNHTVFSDWKRKRYNKLHAEKAQANATKTCQCRRRLMKSELTIHQSQLHRMNRNHLHFISTVRHAIQTAGPERIDSDQGWHVSANQPSRGFLLAFESALHHMKTGYPGLRKRDERKLAEALDSLFTPLAAKTESTPLQLAKALGVFEGDVEALVRQGCIFPSYLGEDEYLFSSNAASQLLEGLRERISEVYPQADEKDSDNLKTILRNFGAGFDGVGLRVKAMLGGFISDWICNSCGGTVEKRRIISTSPWEDEISRIAEWRKAASLFSESATLEAGQS
jgi:hypothetical protein